MKTRNLIIYAYLTLLAGTLIGLCALLSYGASTLDQSLTPRSHQIMMAILWFCLAFNISLILLAPQPSHLTHVTVFGETMTVDGHGNLRNERGTIILTLEDGEKAEDIEALLQYDYQDNKPS